MKWPHTIEVLRQVANGGEDDRGHQETTEQLVLTVSGHVQEQLGREVPTDDQGGITVINARVFVPGKPEIRASDVLRRKDTGERYSVEFAKDPDGTGHHLEIDARKLAVGVAA